MISYTTLQGTRNILVTLIQELSPKTRRSASNLFMQLFWSSGILYLSVVAYFIRDWRNVQLAATLPTVVTLLWIWLIPESPMWCLVRGKKFQALKTLQLITDKAEIEELFDEYLQTVKAPGRTSITKVKITIIDLFKNKILRRHLLVMVHAAFSANLGYFGILFYITDLAGSMSLPIQLVFIIIFS